MKHAILASVTFPLLLATCLAGSKSTNDYRLVWSDDFETDGKPNSANWTYERGFVRNHELQWYQPENAVCKGGQLIIEGRKERKPNPEFQKDAKDWNTNREFVDYTSACLTTKSLHSWQYGKFEVKARIKVQSGLWPGIWFLGVNGEWPSCGEIDLMESYGGNILANACWGTEVRGMAKWASTRTPVVSLGDPQWDEQFHVWRMDWDRDSIKLYVDDKLLNTVDVTKMLNPTDRGPENPFRQPHYLLLNLAIGGDSGGDPTHTPFPTRYEIEYVRVYQLKTHNE